MLTRAARVGVAVTVALLAAFANAAPAHATADGHIAFTSNRDSGNAEIYLMHGDGAEPTRVTDNPASDGAAALSPDGTKLVFETNRDGNNEIYSMNADGSGLTRLTNDPAFDGSPAFSPDGTKVVFQSARDGNNEIYSMNADGSGQTNLTNNAAFDSDPDFTAGAKIVFESNRDAGNPEIYSMNADGTGQSRLTNDGSVDVEPVLSPDGTKVAFSSNRFAFGSFEIHLMNADGSNVTRLTTGLNAFSPTFSPDGAKIAFGTEVDPQQFAEVHVINVDGTNDTRLTNNNVFDVPSGWATAANTPETQIDSGPPEGSTTSASPTFGFSSPGNPGATFECRVDDGTFASCSSPKLIGPLLPGIHTFRVRAIFAGVRDPTPSSRSFRVSGPANGRIVFTSSRDGSVEIYTMNADGSGQTRLTNNLAVDSSPVLSANGAKVVFASDRDGNYEIYSMNVDGTGQTNLTNNTAADETPSFSPDGTKVVFASDRDDPNIDIYSMNADGTGQTRLTTNSAFDYSPSFSPDGTKVVFESDRDGNNEIYSMNADGTGQTRLMTNPASEDAPSFSPDGTKIVFTSNRDGNDEIYSMNANGTGQTRLTTNPANDAFPSFSPDGTKVAFSSNRAGAGFDIHYMNADGSSPTRLTGTGDNSSPRWGSAPTGLPNTTTSPESHNFGTVTIGTSSEAKDFTLTNNGPGTLTVSGVTVDPPSANFSVALRDGPSSCNSVAVGQSCVIRATASPQSAGLHSALLNITSNAGSQVSPRVTVTGQTPTGPPDTRIDSGPEEGETITETDATFAFSSPDASGASFECKLDGGVFSPCNSPAVASGLTPGAHTFSVRALLGGFPDPTPASRSFSVTSCAPPICLTPNPLDFGPTTVGGQRGRTLKVKNTSDADLAYTWDVSGAAFQAKTKGPKACNSGSAKKLYIESGKFCELDVFFKPNSEGEIVGSLPVSGENRKGKRVATHEALLRGQGVPASFAVTPGSIEFGPRTVDAQTSEFLRIKNTSGVELEFRTTTPKESPFTVDQAFDNTGTGPCDSGDSRRIFVDPGKSCLIAIRFRPPTKTAFSTFATISAFTRHGHAAAGLREVQLSGQGVPASFAVTPGSIEFGPRTVDAQTSEFLRIKNTSGVELEFRTTTPKESPFTVDQAFDNTGTGPCDSGDSRRIFVDPGKSCLIAIRFRPPTKTAFSTFATISAFTRHGHAAAGLREVQLSGQGVPASFAVTPGSIEFGPRTVDAQTSEFLRIKNTSGVELEFRTTTPKESPFTVDQAFDNTGTGPCDSGDSRRIFVDPGKSCLIAIRFRPPTKTAFSTFATISAFTRHGHAAAGLREVQLSGQGVPASFAVTPGSIEFGPRTVDAQTSEFLRIKNTSGVELEFRTTTPKESPFTVDQAFDNTGTGPCDSGDSRRIFVDPGKSCLIAIRFRPPTKTAFSTFATISAFTRHGHAAAGLREVQLSGQGVPK